MRITRAKRQAAARKAVRTKARNQAKRKADARKAARTRRAKRSSTTKKHAQKRSPI